MSKKKDGSLRVEETPPAHRQSITAVAFWTCFCLAVILYFAFFFMTRTEGFRSYLSSYFAERLGMPVKIGASQSDFRMNVILTDFIAGDTNRSSLAGVRIGKAEVDWTFRDLIMPNRSSIKGLKIDYGQISFAMNVEGVWEPNALGALSELLDKWSGGKIRTPTMPPAARPAVSEPTKNDEGGKAAPRKLAMDKMSIDLSNCRLIWWGPNREELAFVDGLRLTVTPIELPNRTAKHYHLQAESAMAVNGARVDKLDFEILETAGQSIVLGFKAADWGGLSRTSTAEEDEDMKSLADTLRDAMNSPE